MTTISEQKLNRRAAILFVIFTLGTTWFLWSFLWVLSEAWRIRRWAAEAFPEYAKQDGFGQGSGVSLSGDASGARFSKDGDNAGFNAMMIGYFSGHGIVVMTKSDNGMALAAEIIYSAKRVCGWDS
jgi:hypothetical protein